MSKKIKFILFFIFAVQLIWNEGKLCAQNNTLDSLNAELKKAKQDSSRLQLRAQIADASSNYRVPFWDSIYKESLRQKLKRTEAFALSNLAFSYNNKGNVKKAIEYYFKTLQLSRAMNDKKRIAQTLSSIGNMYNTQGEIKTALMFCNGSLKIREEIGDREGVATSLSNIGLIYADQGEMLKALELLNKGLKIRESIGDKSGIANSLSILGGIYADQGNVPKAIEYLTRSLKICEETGSKIKLAIVLGKFGGIYSDQGDYVKALEFYTKGLKIREELGNKLGISGSLHNIGLIYYRTGDLEKALQYYEKSLKLREEVGNKKGIAHTLVNIGMLKRKKGLTAEALDYFIRSLRLTKEVSEKEGIASAYNEIGVSYLKLAGTLTSTIEKKKHLSLALCYADSSLSASKKIGFPFNIRNAERTHYKIDSAMANYAGAHEHYKQFVIYRDSLFNDENRKASVKSQLKFEYDKKEAVLKEQREKERALSKEKHGFQQIIIVTAGFGLILVIIFAFYIFRSLKTARIQKKIIEVKQREILDSIHYAKKIQRSLMTSDKHIQRILENLYK